MKKEMKCTGIPFDEIRLQELRDPIRARIAVKIALLEFEKDNDIEFLLDTLRLVAKAQGGLADLARKTSISRQALHEALSAEGNPRLRTFQNLLEGLGLRIIVKALPRRRALVKAVPPRRALVS